MKTLPSFMVLVSALVLIGVAGFLIPPEKERRFAYFCIAGLIGSIVVSVLGGVAIVRLVFALWAMIVLISVFLAIYFVPTIIAKNRRHRNFMAIAVVNLLLGWSFIFWVVALVWSLWVVDDEVWSPGDVVERTAMTRTHFAEGQVLFREGDPSDSVFRVLSGAVEILREIGGKPILLGTVGAGQFIGEMGVVENRSRSATVRAASEVEVETLTPTEFFDQIAGSPQAARDLIRRLSQRLREADDRIVKDERRNDRPHGRPTDADSQAALVPANNLYLAAKDPWLQRQLHTKLALTDLPFVVGRGPVTREGGSPLHPDLKLDDTVPFRLSRNHFMILKRDGSYYVQDLRSTLGTIVNGQPIGEHFRIDDAPLRAGENEVIAGGVDSRFVFSVFIA